MSTHFRAAVLSLAMFAPMAPAQLIVTKVALNGDTAPGTGGLFFVQPGGGSVNNFGEVVFNASLSDGSTALFSTGSGTLALVARSGTAAPGGGTFNGFIPASIDVTGGVAFGAFLDSNTASGLYAAPTGEIGSLVKLFKTGDVAPNAGGRTFTHGIGQGFSPSFHRSGQRAFAASLSSGGSGIFTNTSGSFDKFLLNGDAAPGSGGLTYSSFVGLSGALVSINSTGKLLFKANLSDGTAGYFTNTSGSTVRVIRTGESDGAGSTVLGLTAATLSDSGAAVIRLDLTSGVDAGMYRYSAGTLTRLAKTGEVAPGTGGLTYTSIGLIPTISSAGEVAFNVGLSSSQQAIFKTVGGSLTKAYQTGESAPGVTGGQFGGFGPAVINGSGHLAFVGAFASGPGGVTGTTDGALWAQGSDGVLQLIAREGQFWDLDGAGPGTATKQIRSFSGLGMATGSAGQAGLPSGWSDSYWLSFSVAFDDDTRGDYLVLVSPIPEPASLGLVATTGLLALRLVRRRWSRRRI